MLDLHCSTANSNGDSMHGLVFGRLNNVVEATVRGVDQQADRSEVDIELAESLASAIGAVVSIYSETIGGS